jgi:hypothetical protein
MLEMVFAIVGLAILMVVSWYTDKSKKHGNRGDYYDG